jgi:hypothetical protein
LVEKIIKRDDRVVDYDIDKIRNAIYNASLEVYDKEKSKAISEDISTIIDNYLNNNYDKSNYPSVENIQDTVEEVLMKNDYTKVAKRYIIYRSQREKVRGKKDNKGLLTDEFLSKYKHQPNPFPTELGEFIYYRTYSRWLPEEGRREYWWETVRRAVEYNCSLAPTTKKEAEELYDNIYHLRNFLAGRTLWTGFTKSSIKYPMSNFNCSYATIDSLDAYLDIFYLLMVGSGTGFRVLPEDVEKLPKLRTDIDILHQYYEPVEKDERREYTDFVFDETDTVVTVNVGDSKEGKLSCPSH